MTWLDSLTDKALARELPTRDEALKVLTSQDDELMDVVAAAFKVRLRYFGRRVKLNYLVNIKSGLCPEDCFYCSAAARLGRGRAEVHLAQAGRGGRKRPKKGSGRRQARLPGGQRPRPDRQRRHPGVGP